MARVLVAVVVALLTASLPAVAEGATIKPPGFEERTIAYGLAQPTAVDWLPDGRMLVAEKPGRVRMIGAGGLAAAKPWLDLSAHVNAYGDRGLLGIAVDKQFLTHPYVYLLYVYDTDAVDDSNAQTSRLTRVRVTDGVPGPEEVLVGGDGALPCGAPDNDNDCIPADRASHAIGTVVAAPDGTLFLGSGDGMSDTVSATVLRTRDERSLAGKIMRVDREGRGLQDHPFCRAETDLSKTCTKVYAKGFRNPFRFTLRPDGTPAVADVGQDAREEIDLVKPGRDYGWPCWEGTIQPIAYKGSTGCQQALSADLAGARTPPDHEYAHGTAGASITGGPTYTGTGYPPEYTGSLFFGDFVTRTVKRLVLDGDRVVSVADFGSEWEGGAQLVTAPDGDLVHVNVIAGRVRQWSYTAANRAPAIELSATPSGGGRPLTVAFDTAGSGDPDGDALTFTWDFGDGTEGTGAAPTHVYAEAGTYTARVTADDGRGGTATDTAVITVGEGAPTASILTPGDESTFRVGERVELTGAGEDPQGEPVTYDWDVELQHNQHVHVLTAASGPTTEFVPGTDHDADSFYRVTLTVTDAEGLRATARVTLRPQTAPLTLQSVPAGVALAYDGAAKTTPYTVTAAVGYGPVVTAPESTVLDGRTYRFEGWSDGGERSHAVQAGADAASLTATYAEVPPALPLRIDLGGSGGDATGTPWSRCAAAADCPGAIARAGAPYTTTALVSRPIAPASDALYPNGWQGSTAATAGQRTVALDVPVPNGRYRARLHFAETTATGAGQRVFDIDAEEGEVDVRAFDPLAAAGGARRGVVREVRATVQDGVLDLDLLHRTGATRLSALEVLEETSAPDTTAPLPVGGLVATPSSGRVDLRWTTPPADVTAVRILRSTVAHATSPEPSAQQVLVHEGLGTTTAVTGLPNGVLQRFTAFAQDAAGNWSPAATATAMPRAIHRVNLGGGALSSGSTAWSACTTATTCAAGVVKPSGGTASVRSTAPAISGVVAPAVPALYHSLWGGGATVAGARAFGLDVAVPSGRYRVRLHFAETLRTAPRQRVFDVNVNEGTFVELPGLDVFAAAGGANRALVRQVDTTVGDGVLDIDFVRRTDAPFVNAVEIIPIA